MPGPRCRSTIEHDGAIRKCWTATKTEITFLLHGYPLSDHNLNHRRTALTLKGERTPEELSHWREAEHAHDLKQDNRYNEDDPHDP